MAMSRSIGGSSLTTVSPIMIWPDVMVSSPATIRSVVVLPHPEGPTMTRNSSSLMSRFTSLTAWTSSYILWSCRIRTRAIASPFDRAGQPGNVVLDKEGVDQRYGDRAEQRTCHQRTPEEHVAANKFGGDAHWHGFFLWRRQ